MQHIERLAEAEMLFCPVCANSLVTNSHHGETNTDGVRFECRTCTYVHQVSTRLEREVPNLPKKRVDDVLGGDNQWELADKTEVTCPKCTHNMANFFQMQTRSADEPMTVFYRCTKCAHRWKEN